MALPEGVSTCTVTFGVAADFAGNPVTTKISFKPSTTVLHEATGTPLVGVSTTVATDAGEGSIELPHTDQAGFVDVDGQPVVDWSYIATGQWESSGGERIPFRKEFLLPSYQTTVDLDLVYGGAVGVPPPPPTMIGPAGPAGPPGESIVGPAGPQGDPGRDGRDGQDSTVPGPVGAAGISVTSGTGAPTGTAPTGTQYLDVSTGDLYRFD